MRVLCVLGNLDPAVGGPPASSVHGCIAAARAGVEVTVAVSHDPAAPDAGAPFLDRLRAAAIPTLRFATARLAPGAALRWGISLGLARWFLANRSRFDVVHCHAPWQWMSLVALVPCRGARPARVLSPHEGLTRFDLAQTPRPAMKLAKTVLKPLLIRGFDRIVLSSALEARDSLGEREAATKAAVIAHPVFDETVHRPSPRGGPLAPGRLRLGFLGRLHNKKNLDLLIRAVARLPETVTLAVAGDGPERARLVRLAGACGVAGRIDWLGFVAEPGKDAFFAGIDLLAMPSAYECFGLAAAEAIARGVPALVSPDTGVAEIVAAQRCGTIARPEPDAIAAAVRELLARPETLRAQAQATAAAAASLSFAAHGNALRACYEAAVAEKGLRN